MTLPNSFKTLTPIGFSELDTLRLSVRRGWEDIFLKIISKYDSDSLNEIINDVKITSM